MMATTQAAIEKLVQSPKYVQRRGESFGRLLVFLMNALPREHKLPFIAGFVDTISKALPDLPPAIPATAARRRRTIKRPR